MRTSQIFVGECRMRCVFMNQNIVSGYTLLYHRVNNKVSSLPITGFRKLAVCLLGT